MKKLWCNPRRVKPSVGVCECLVAQSCQTPWDAMDFSPPCSCPLGFSRQEQRWMTMPSFRGSSQPRSPSLQTDSFPVWATRKPSSTSQHWQDNSGTKRRSMRVSSWPRSVQRVPAWSLSAQLGLAWLRPSQPQTQACPTPRPSRPRRRPVLRPAPRRPRGRRVSHAPPLAGLSSGTKGRGVFCVSTRRRRVYSKFRSRLLVDAVALGIVR